MNQFLAGCAALLLILLSGPALADFYTWEDADGNVHITNHPPPQSQAGKDLRVHKAQPSQTQVDQKPADVEKKPDIVLYTKTDCAECDKARDFLNERGLTFTEFNIDTDEDAKVKRRSIDDSEEVPFAIINRAQVYGFSEAMYNRVLKVVP